MESQDFYYMLRPFLIQSDLSVENGITLTLTLSIRRAPSVAPTVRHLTG